jgi:hypothetical protein
MASRHRPPKSVAKWMEARDDERRDDRCKQRISQAVVHGSLSEQATVIRDLSRRAASTVSVATRPLAKSADCCFGALRLNKTGIWMMDDFKCPDCGSPASTQRCWKMTSRSLAQAAARLSRPTVKRSQALVRVCSSDRSALSPRRSLKRSTGHMTQVGCMPRADKWEAAGPCDLLLGQHALDRHATAATGRERSAYRGTLWLRISGRQEAFTLSGAFLRAGKSTTSDPYRPIQSSGTVVVQRSRTRMPRGPSGHAERR